MFPIHFVTVASGNVPARSDSHDARSECHSRVHGSTPARRMIRSNCVRRFAFRHPDGPVARFRYSSGKTYSLPSAACSNAAARCGRRSGNRGMMRCGFPWCRVFGEGMLNRPRSQSTSPHVRENASDGIRSPPKRASATSNFHQTFGQWSMVRAMFATVTYARRSDGSPACWRTYRHGFTARWPNRTASSRNCRAWVSRL